MLKTRLLLASFYILSVVTNAFATKMQRFSSFLALQKSLHGPIDVSLHSFFVSQDPVHIVFWQERVVVETCIRSFSLNMIETADIRFEGLFAVRDAGQELVTIEVRFCPLF